MIIGSSISRAVKRPLVSGLSLVLGAAVVTAVAASTTTAAVDPARTPEPPATPAAMGGGQHDFDWEIGAWRTTVRILADPLSGSPDRWLRFRGTSIIRPLLDGQANVVELRLSGLSGEINGLNLRLHEPAQRRWSLTFANLRDGMLTASVFGSFDHRAGQFYGDDHLDGRPIKVRFLINRHGPDRARFEQAFSDDGGITWETNWIAEDTRMHPNEQP